MRQPDRLREIHTGLLTAALNLGRAVTQLKTALAEGNTEQLEDAARLLTSIGKQLNEMNDVLNAYAAEFKEGQ